MEKQEKVVDEIKKNNTIKLDSVKAFKKLDNIKVFIDLTSQLNNCLLTKDKKEQICKMLEVMLEIPFKESN